MEETKKQTGYYEGQLMIATPRIHTGSFEKAVIYICVHNQDGAMGVMVNQTIENMTSADVLKQFNITKKDTDIQFPVYFGGPVDSVRGFVLHGSDYHGKTTLVTEAGVSLTSELAILEAIAAKKGPSNFNFALGYTGWQAGQLEAEIEANNWFSAPATHDIIFGQDNGSKWLRASELVGVNPFMFSDDAGHA